VGGSNTLTNLGQTHGILFDGSAGSKPALETSNLLVNRGAALTGTGQATIRMVGGPGFNALDNFASGVGFALSMEGNTGPDLVYNEAPSAPLIRFDAAGSPDRGTWSFPLGDVLHNLGDGVQAIEYTAADDASPDWLLNAGANVPSITMQGGLGYNLLTNYGAGATNVLLTGAALPAGGVPGVQVIGGATPNYGDTPADANILENHGAGAQGLTLIGGHGLTSLANDAANVSGVLVTVGDGILEFINSAAGVNLHDLGIVGGSLADYVRNDASGLEILNISLGDGADVFDNRGADVNSGTVDLGEGANTFLASGANLSGITFSSGGGADLFVNQGSNSHDVLFASGGGADLFPQLLPRFVGPDVRRRARKRHGGDPGR